ncbi:MAG TPA: tetratricopeptide repeat protein [Candidatus Deferrimicrobiaceae bacterium]
MRTRPAPHRILAGPLSVLFLLLSGGCAPRGAALLPSPPSEVRRATAATAARTDNTAPRIDNAAPVPPPGPDYGRLYREAVARTRDLLAKGNSRDALPLWDGFGESPFAAEAAFNRGVLLQLTGDTRGASEQYRRAASAPLRSEPAAANLLGIALLAGNRDALREVVENVGRPIASLPGDRTPEFLGNLAAAFGELSRTGEADALQRTIVSNGGSTPALRWNQTVIAWKRGDVAAARKLSSELAPAMSGLWPVEASRVAWDRDASRVPPLDGSAEPRLRAMSRNLSAYREWEKGNAPAARSLLEEAAGGTGHTAEYQTNIGIVLASQGRWKDARAAFERAAASDPELPEGWLNLGLFREVYLGDGPGALSCYDRYVTLNGSRKDEVVKWSEWLRKSTSSR